MVLLEGDCQIPVFCGCEQIRPPDMARIAKSEPSAPENPKEPRPCRAGQLNRLLQGLLQIGYDIVCPLDADR